VLVANHRATVDLLFKELCMAAEKADLRELNLGQLFPWTQIFRAFWIAVDYKKLAVAALGLLFMSLGWWLLAVVFLESREKPDWNSGKYTGEARDKEWARFKDDLAKWNLLWEAAGYKAEETDAYDLAATPAEVEEIKKQIDAGNKEFAIGGRNVHVKEKPWGKLRTLPWFEDRGPNPYLLATGQAGRVQPDGTVTYYPWEKGLFWDWLFTRQLPYIAEPLIKLLRPVIYLLQDHAGFWNRVYFVLALLWSLAVWALCGGAITRMAVVQLARKEKIGIGEAFRFTLSKYLAFFTAPLLPLIGVLAIVVFMIVFGFFSMIPLVGDVIVAGIGWFLVVLAGLVAAIILVCLVCWPMMHSTISAEGSDSFDALSRSYSYILGGPWHYIWFALVALAYGVIVVFFVGFMGSLAVYLAKWGVSQTPGIAKVDREPEYLFVYAPTSLDWRALLLHRSAVVTDEGTVRQEYLDSFKWYNYLGAWMVGGFWMYTLFLMVVGFSYSYFWTASTIIYLLMRRHVDDTELDEVYLEEEESEDGYQPTYVPPPTAPASAGGSPVPTMVEAPTLKTSTPTPAASAPTETHKEQGDGNPPPP
jgi:hypothetical protein